MSDLSLLEEHKKRWETYLLYKRYQATGRLPEEQYKKLVDGLVDIIRNCYNSSFEPVILEFRKRTKER